ncbi:MAG TPA: phospholipase D-like domain-containing protein [Dissulfurispiraceae bacterium]|nr:phospholipase D-like domain-containing protein [Dissulfurispiraceae bacterium]
MTDGNSCRTLTSFTRHAIETIYKGLFSSSTRVKLLSKGDRSFSAIFDAVRSAREIICLQFYIFRNDETGIELAEILKQKSKQGVSVYLLYDHFGSFGTPRSFWQELADAGIKVAASHPFKWTSPFHYAHRDHRKLIIVDLKYAFTGGLNIANEYRGFHRKLRRRVRWKSWRDTGIMLEGPIVPALFNSFRKSWYVWKKERIMSQTVEPFDKERLISARNSAERAIPVLPIFTSGARGRRKMRRMLYYSINRSQKIITLTTPYFTPSHRMLETLENAIRRGVKVRLLIPGESDVPAAYYVARAFFSRLLKAGVEIYTYTGEILHAKTYVFDDCWSIIGSTNLDFRSLRYNDEGSVGILDEQFARGMHEIFEEDIRHSAKIELEPWRRRPFSEKAKEWFFSIFRRRL